MLIRHAEKPVIPPPDGVLEDGSKDKHSLTPRGWQRAGALVQFFVRPYRSGITTPTVIFASGTTEPTQDLIADDAKSLRPEQTVLPLSRRLGVATNISVPVGLEESLITSLRETDGTVLVAWEHKRIPTIAAGFVRNPPSWGDRFDVVWILDRQPDDSYTLAEVPQDLLDSDEPARD